MKRLANFGRAASTAGLMVLLNGCGTIDSEPFSLDHAPPEDSENQAYRDTIESKWDKKWSGEGCTVFTSESAEDRNHNGALEFKEIKNIKNRFRRGEKITAVAIFWRGHGWGSFDDNFVLGVYEYDTRKKIAYKEFPGDTAGWYVHTLPIESPLKSGKYLIVGGLPRQIEIQSKNIFEVFPSEREIAEEEQRRKIRAKSDEEIAKYLKMLKELKDSKTITEEEFQSKRKFLIDRL